MNPQKLSKEMVSRAFTSLGFQSHRTSTYRGYVVVRRSPEEMRSLRYSLAAGQPGDDVSSGNDATDGNDANDSVF